MRKVVHCANADALCVPHLRTSRLQYNAALCTQNSDVSDLVLYQLVRAELARGSTDYPCLPHNPTLEGTVHSVGGGRMLMVPMLMYEDADADADIEDIWCLMINYENEK